jgi:hypothetical protein
MKAAVIGAFVGALVSACVSGALPFGSTAHADRPAFQAAGSLQGNGELITSTAMTSDNRQLVTIIDPKTRVLAVYVVDGTTGNVALKSVRNFHWDLQLVEFNGSNPLPREIQSLIEQPLR